MLMFCLIFLLPVNVNAATYFKKECYYKNDIFQYCEFVDMNEKVEKYCKGKNYDDNKCDKYCRRVKYTHGLCQRTDSQINNQYNNVLNEKRDPQFAISESSVYENSKAGTQVFEVELVDSHLFKGYKFSLGEGNDGAFDIGAANGNITVKDPKLLDFEIRRVYEIDVLMDDVVSDNLYKVPIKINILDKKEDWKCKIGTNENITTVSHEKFIFDTNLKVSRIEDSEKLVFENHDHKIISNICERGEFRIELDNSVLSKDVVLIQEGEDFIFIIRTVKKKPFLFFFSRKVVQIDRATLKGD